jgi:hypothetical protein
MYAHTWTRILTVYTLHMGSRREGASAQARVPSSCRVQARPPRAVRSLREVGAPSGIRRAMVVVWVVWLLKVQ